MSKIKPLTLRFDTLKELEDMKAEYDFIGRETEINRKKLELVVLTLPRKYKKKTAREAKNKQNRHSDNYDDYN